MLIDNSFASLFERGCPEEDLVVGEVGDAGQHVRVAAAQGEGGLHIHDLDWFTRRREDAKSLC